MVECSEIGRMNVESNYLSFIIRDIQKSNTQDIGRWITILKANEAGEGREEKSELFSRLEDAFNEYQSAKSTASNGNAEEALSRLYEAAQAYYAIVHNN